MAITHCRFEAKQVFGIEDVIVADLNEFLAPTVLAKPRESRN